VKRTCTRAVLPVFLLLLASSTAPAADLPRAQPAQAGASQEASRMSIRIELEGRSLTATLENSEAARDFLSLLPLTLTLTDYNSTEKVADLPGKLSTQGAPAGVDPQVGDIAYYAPWGNLALFYRDFGYSRGLVKLGRLDTGVEFLRGRGPLRVTIQRAER
jgi:hypothetical protein